MSVNLDIKGRRFGRLVALNYISGSRSKKAKWGCLCDCGNETEVTTNNLTSGKTCSCGCIASEIVTKRNKKHGMRNTQVYKTWCSMLNRCNNKNATSYENYGGRGIKVCKRWLEFSYFYEDMGEQPVGHSIERVDVDKGYSRDNCVWIHASKQAANKRVFKNNTSGFKGVSISGGNAIAYWSYKGAQKRKYFSIRKYGFNEALDKAKKERECQINKLIKLGVIMENIDNLKSIMLAAPEGATHVSQNGVYYKDSEYQALGVLVWWNRGEEYIVSEIDHVTRSLSDIKTIIELSELLSKINGAGFLSVTHESSVTHKEICKEYEDLISKKWTQDDKC